jgi:DMSO/TMAO reductase YedYZ molybdopterin-dependent catalytic subunit
MRRPSIAFGAIVGGLTSLPAIALLYLGNQVASLPFVPFDLFDWLARVLPGDLITFTIHAIVRLIDTLNLGPTSGTAKRIEQLMALLLFIGGGLVLGAVIAWALRGSDQSAARVGATAGGIGFVVIAVIELGFALSGGAWLSVVWLAIVFIGWGALIGSLLTGTLAMEPTAEEQAARRAALLRIAGGSAAVALAGWGLGRLLSVPTDTGAGQPLANVPTVTGPESVAIPQASATEPTQMAQGAATVAPQASATPVADATAAATMRERVEPAPGTRPEITPNEDFYRIDINTRPVVVNGDSWVLEIDGLFDKTGPLTLEDLMAYPAITQPITLSCISNRIGGDLIGTSNWTGVRLRDLLKDLGLQAEAKALFVEGADGFFETVVMDDMMDPRTLLVYGMNGETLPVEHGFPLRIYIPNRYGMKQPKWITRITAMDSEKPGYWVQRGWSKEARPHIVSIIDTVAKDEPVDGKAPVGGIAWAGDRGIQKVEVQIDDGEWHEAVLRTPPLSGLTWIQWRYDWPADPGSHTVRVRATDGTGTLQIEKQSPPAPNGATGYHSVTARI